MLEVDGCSREFFENFSSPPTLSANSQMSKVTNSQSANSQIMDFKKIFFLDNHDRRSRAAHKPSEEQYSSRLIESFSRNSRDFANSQCKFSNHLRICILGGFENLHFAGGRISGSDGFWSPDSGSSRGGRTKKRREVVLTHRCAVYCIFRGISGGGANSQMSTI